MQRDKEKLTKVRFNDNWCCCCCSNESGDINDIIGRINDSDSNRISIQLPHLINENICDNNIDDAKNWWYLKEFEWRRARPNLDQRIRLRFESINDNPMNKKNSSMDTMTIWLNKNEIFSGSFEFDEISVDISEQLYYGDDQNEKNSENTLIIRCLNGTFRFDSSLLFPVDLIDAIKEEKIKMKSKRHQNRFPMRKYYVLDYLISFNDINGQFQIDVKSKSSKDEDIYERMEEDCSNDEIGDDNENRLSFGINDLSDYVVEYNDKECCFDINLNSKCKYSNSDGHEDVPNIVVSEEYDEKVDYRNSIDDFDVPHLSIVMLIVGTRGDVQPFVALGKRLRSVGHRVRLSTHEKFRRYVRENGLEFYPLASNPDDLMSFMVKNGGMVPSMNSLMDGDVKKSRRDISNILISTWQACIENDDETSLPFTAEVIIANPPSFGHIHCAQKLQIPLHMMFTMPWSPTTQFPHAFCQHNSSKLSKEKMNFLSYSIIDALTWSGIHDLVNDFRRNTLELPPLHTRQALRTLFNEHVPHTYCWSPTLVPRPYDWSPHIDVAGYFFLDTDINKFQPTEDLMNFLGLNNDNEKKSKFDPPIYIGFGSIRGNDSDHLLQVILNALERTGYRAILSGFQKYNQRLSDQILKVGDVPHDWLFRYVSSVCHHGGAGTTAAGLRAGKPTIIIPFFGDQFFWGNVVSKCGAGPLPIPGKHLTVDQLVEAFKKVHQREMREVAEDIGKCLLNEDGCGNALRMFYANLPLSRMRSDLESSFVACYRIDQYDLQVSRSVAQVLIGSGSLDESQFHHHVTRQWTSMYDDRTHLPMSGAVKHTRKAFSHLFIHTAGGMKRAISSGNVVVGVANGVGGACKEIGKSVGHLTVGGLSFYGELTDVLARIPALYDRYGDIDEHKRPHVTDLKSGVNAAGLSIVYGWKDGIHGFVRKPRVGYHRHGIIGGASGVLAATANGFVKPTVGSLSSITWLGRGVYASLTNKRRNKNIQKPNVFADRSPEISPSDNDDNDDEETDHDEISRNIKFAAVLSGYSPQICQQILDQFEKIKRSKEQNAALSSNQTFQHHSHSRFKLCRRHSDSAL